MTPKEAGSEEYVRWSKHLFKHCFHSLNPPLAYLPHCLFSPDREALATILRVVSAKGGILGDQPSWVRDGEVYIGSVEERPEEFVLWELPHNQESVLRDGAFAEFNSERAPYYQFTAVIDTRTPQRVIKEIYAAADSPDTSFFCYDWWIENFARWLPELRWACLPLAKDSPFAMFVACDSDKALVDVVKLKLEVNGIHAFSLVVDGRNIVWPREEYGQEHVRRSQDWLRYCFGSIRPPLAYLPHCLFEQDKEALAAVLKATNARGGIFGDMPLRDRDGRPYIGYEEDEFSLWELSENQADVFKHGAYAKLSQFTMVIDTQVFPRIIKELYATAELPDAGISCYDWWIENIVRWLPELRWTYIPLNDETPFAIFVVRESDRALVEAVKSELSAKSIHWFSLTVEGNKVMWPHAEIPDRRDH